MARDIELIHRPPTGVPRRAPPLLFVHGAYVGAWCWAETFMPYFSGLGYDCHALSLSGHAGSAGRERLDWLGLSDYQADLAQACAGLAQPPILIAHSLGGHIAQRYAREAPLAGLALLASVAPYGLAASFAFMGWSAPHLLLGLNRFQWHLGLETLDMALLRELLFSPELGREQLASFAARAQPESSLALAELMMPHPLLMVRNPADLPCLVLGVEHDRIIPHIDVRSTAHAWHVEPQWVNGVGHALMMDAGWETAASRVANWLITGWG
ncbi:alpha/beta hydrolase [Chitinolyticbacter albus]|uniref:alpha/beta hydrolase n=1 Tax=Chitinolyticbacter albus TaxID=2961951 RepID=UPI002108CFBD|nr:alpha/beta hydrolase [Chitinolyticbacter albus]